ncbi:MAG: undecaprenyldiphospho-muramoylpentapeptide beta-N-acetylglucosaminyltransferase [Bacteroidales bacterium]|jgi:UDP-N-acetylglucosamine--N-acetylmuramyl-(pentapeptide) pyrophosphoryl-undecaprenol N-acetylglucosamine transferase|nr:undecaprenyldiphospho-muramoylpentapeptide beta-N-acetylglucosaminyltransferase [Bacteroidales bacterium]
MKKKSKSDKICQHVIISGGGTGGHIFPAIAIANAFIAQNQDTRILFVGAKGRMEMEKVPAAGYKIIGLPVQGFNRKNLLRNFKVVYKLIVSLFMAVRIVGRFRPDVVIGVGGYASGPVLFAASLRGVPTLIQEQNSYAGVTNRILSGLVKKICVAYEEMDKYFPARKIVITGNPVREQMTESIMRDVSIRFFDFTDDKPTILVLGGSLGARTINRSVLGCLDTLPPDIHLVWQTGSEFEDRAHREVAARKLQGQVKVFRFINRMDLAFAAADLVISRAGASTISELCITGKPCILVPSPNVAEDHQTKNAMALVNKSAAIMITDKEAMDKLMNTAIATVQQQETLEPFSENIRKLAKFNAAQTIAEIAMGLIETKQDLCDFVANIVVQKPFWINRKQEMNKNKRVCL